MISIKRVFGYLHIGLALVVACQFIASPMYGGDLNGQIWDIVSIAMAIGAVSALIFATLRMLEVEGPHDWGAKVMLIASLASALLVWRLFLSSQVFDSAEKPPYEFRLLMWYGIDVLSVLVNLFVGRYLLHAASRS